jgi:hypothetical protein
MWSSANAMTITSRVTISHILQQTHTGARKGGGKTRRHVCTSIGNRRRMHVEIDAGNGSRMTCERCMRRQRRGDLTLLYAPSFDSARHHLRQIRTLHRHDAAARVSSGRIQVLRPKIRARRRAGRGRPTASFPRVTSHCGWCEGAQQALRFDRVRCGAPRTVSRITAGPCSTGRRGSDRSPDRTL